MQTLPFTTWSEAIQLEMVPSLFGASEKKAFFHELRAQEQTLINRPFPTYLVPLLQNESLCKTFYIINNKFHSLRMVLQEDSF